MSLGKNDLKSIEQMFFRFESKINEKIDATQKNLKKDIFNVEDKLSAKMEALENKVIAVISREVADLAEINHEVIKRVDIVGELDKRVTRLENKFGLKPL
ncbi:MAG: hypothetical protein WCW17_03470 [Patescibacteria group bacterium]|jgi:hypothetical protein